jgi:pyridoxine kinase
LIDRAFTGTGDLTTAVFLAHWLRGESLNDVLGATASAVFSVLAVTADLGRYELALVQAQDDILNPRHTFTAIPA